MFQATRRRLALWYTTVTAILLLLFASGFYGYVRSTLIERIDDTLNHVVEVVERSLVIEPVDFHKEGGDLRINVEASFRNNPHAIEDDHIDLEWFSPTGDLLWSTLVDPLNLPLHPDLDGETVTVARGVLRQVTQRVQVGRQMLGYLRVSHPWFEVTKPTRQLIVDLSIGTGLMVLVVGAIGWFLSGLAMAPVRESYQRLKQFTADASHELRNPIATIQTNVQVALADPNPDPLEQQQQLKVVERLTRRLGRLVDNLLFLARQDSGIVQPQSTPVALQDLLKDVIEEQQAIATEKQITLALQVLPPPTDKPAFPLEKNSYSLPGDRDQLARLFTNLVGNAVQYTPTGGQVAIELQRMGRPQSAHLQIKVQDTGIGIPESDLPHLFDRFYRVDPARTHSPSGVTTVSPTATGSGLGLAIAQAIVENHQGQITVESQLHQGTTFTVLLPCNKQD
ncbi:MAG: HAMP domain-containing sensor histidine kinase [Leptolyngbyaceae bacterium]|nr:HAMP domain-containing sensor histidine kinase [Leptolyngbyaceae bacterium]